MSSAAKKKQQILFEPDQKAFFHSNTHIYKLTEISKRKVEMSDFFLRIKWCGEIRIETESHIHMHDP